MTKHDERLDKIQERTGSGGPYKLVIRYKNDYQRPPREPIVTYKQGLTQDTEILIEYVDDWPGVSG